MEKVPQIRVFLASPGDVNDERAIALEVFDLLEYEPLFKRNGAGGVSIHAIAWDKPGGDTPMRATMTPQTAIKQGLLLPSQCDIVVVLFWGRMGTELPYPEYQKPDGTKYLSGTEWEFHDAVRAERASGKPITLVYRRTETPHIDMKNRKHLAQYHAVLDFFEQFSDPSTGVLVGGINEYETPEDLRYKLTTHLRHTIERILAEEGFAIPAGDAKLESAVTTTSRPLVAAPPLWVGSPFPGLRSFTEVDAPIFFGRGPETSDLVRYVEKKQFVCVLGASGSGKSSLVAAGLIPRLKANAIVSGETGSKDWRYVCFTPHQSQNVIVSMFQALNDAFPEHSVSPFMIEKEKEAFVSSVSDKPLALVNICEALLKKAKAPSWVEILFFVDQFEELFTLASDSERNIFISILGAMQSSRRLRVVITVRSDFFASCVAVPAIAALLKEAVYPVSMPTPGALVEMIKRPAERAGLLWDEGLPEQIQAEAGNDLGSLALMAYALDELYKSSVGEGEPQLTYVAYDAIGTVKGVIGKRAERVYESLALPDKEYTFKRVFLELVTVNDRGSATRQRAHISRFGEQELAVIRAFVTARLLVINTEFVEVAHEAVFYGWSRLANWIESAYDYLRILNQVNVAAQEWERNHRSDIYLWRDERLRLVYGAIEWMEAKVSETLSEFIKFECDRLLEELSLPNVPHTRRAWIGDRISVIGDDRRGVSTRRPKAENDSRVLPDISWCEIDPGKVVIEDFGYEYGVEKFYISTYPITYIQYQCFVEDPEGYDNDRWWTGFPSEFKKQLLKSQIARFSSAPRDNVSWFQAVAFARWMNSNLLSSEDILPIINCHDYEIRLPTEWEWQRAALRDNQWQYPWGEWNPGFANTREAGLNRAICVGMYPHATSPFGVMDLAGNVREWCLNLYSTPRIVSYDTFDRRAIRGGAFNQDNYYSRSLTRSMNVPNSAGPEEAFRVVFSKAIT